MQLVTKEWTKEKLRSELLYSVYNEAGNLYNKLELASDCNKPIAKCDAVTYIEGSVKPYLQDIIDYYKLVAKIMVLDNVKDTVSPKYPEYVYVPEHLYKDAQGQVVAVLPGRRVVDARYAGAELEKTVKPAAYLMDNQAHQVVFLNSTIEDKYFIVGNPAFKLEDSTKLELKDTITAEEKNYKCLRNLLQVKGGKQPGGCAEPTYCELPWVAKGSAGTVDPIVNPGGCAPQPNPEQPNCTDCSVSGVEHVMANAIHTISIESYRVKTKAQTVKNAKGDIMQDALAEIQVVFSEPVLNYKLSTDNGSYANRRASGDSVKLWSRSILNPHNWTIDGYNLGRDVLDKNNNVNIRMVSTSIEKQSRDAVIITLDSAKGMHNEFIDRLFNDSVNAEHSITVAKSGDWASATDSQNIVASNNDNFKAMSVEKAKPWYPSIAGGSEEATDIGIQAKYYGRAFVVMSAAHENVPDPTKPGENADIIHVLFSEPMDWTDKDYGVQLFKTYALNSEPLVTKARDIVRGLRGVKGYESSPCAVTIILPTGTLQDNQMFSVVKAKGNNDHLEAALENLSLDELLVEERHSLPYAIQPTYENISEKTLKINGCDVKYKERGFAEKFDASFVPTNISVYTKLGLQVPSFVPVDPMENAKGLMDKAEKAAAKDLTVAENLQAAKDAYSKAKEAVDALADGADKTALLGRLAAVDTKIKAGETPAGDCLKGMIYKGEKGNRVDFELPAGTAEADLTKVVLNAKELQKDVPDAATGQFYMVDGNSVRVLFSTKTEVATYASLVVTIAGKDYNVIDSCVPTPPTPPAPGKIIDASLDVKTSSSGNIVEFMLPAGKEDDKLTKVVLNGKELKKDDFEYFVAERKVQVFLPKTVTTYTSLIATIDGEEYSIVLK